MIGITTAIIHDKRFTRKDGTYPVKLRITYNRQQKYYPTGVRLSSEDWLKVFSEKAKGDYKDNQMFLNKIEKHAVEIIKEMPVFTFTLFEKKFNQKPKADETLEDVFNEYISQLKMEGRISTAYSYNNSLSSLLSYLESKRRKKIHLWEITPEWLSCFEKWIIDKGNSITTVGIYMRSLRTIVNVGIQKGLLDKDSYPFEKRKYVIPSGKNIKKALTIEQIGKVIQYKPTQSKEKRARDLWVFSYLCNGANIKDVAELKFKNIEGNHIWFIRSKTSNTTKQDRKTVSVFILPEIRAIIDEWGVKSNDPDNYVFGIFEKGDTPEIKYQKVYQATKTINKYMKRIGEELKIDIKLTTYAARHSFATVLKRSGAPIEFISESLGHKDLRTTENYLDSFEDDVKETYQRQLLNFKI